MLGLQGNQWQSLYKLCNQAYEHKEYGMKVVLFVIITNALLVGVLFLSDRVVGLLGANYLSDYFFYSLIVQWILGTFFMIPVSGKNTDLKHSPIKATRMAASLAQASETGSSGKGRAGDDMRLSHKLFISGAFSLIMCIVL